MRPSPSLHYVSTLLNQRRRRHHRAQRLWGISLLLLGLGLLLAGWWGTRRLAPRVAPQAAAVAPAVVPARPARATGTRVIPQEPHWGHPVLLEPEACQACACPTLAPWQAACTPSAVVDPGCPPPPWCVMEPLRRPWEQALPERGLLPLQTAGALSDPTPPGLPAREDHPPAPLFSPACGAAPCPAAHAVGRPAPSHARRPAGPRRPARPVPPQRRVSDYEPAVLAEPERLTVSP
jgi:hypothetical protein